jgi:hypothetical protein
LDSAGKDFHALCLRSCDLTVASHGITHVESSFFLLRIDFVLNSPALLSAELSQKWETKITTVINDADLVVRMSGATVGNLLMDLLEFDHKDTLMDDVKQV